MKLLKNTKYRQPIIAKTYFEVKFVRLIKSLKLFRNIFFYRPRLVCTAYLHLVAHVRISVWRHWFMAFRARENHTRVQVRTDTFRLGEQRSKKMWTYNEIMDSLRRGWWAPFSGSFHWRGDPNALGDSDDWG